MKTVVLHLPDSVNLTEQELQTFVLAKLAEAQTATGAAASLTVPAADADEIRHLIGLYYAEKATRLMNEQWEQNGWSAETMGQWLSERMHPAGRKAS